MTKAELKTFLDGFKLTSTGDITDVGKADIKRKALAQYIKNGDDEDAVYEMIGYKQTSVAQAANYETESMTDVTGATYFDFNGKAETIEMSEYILNPNKTKFLEEASKLKIGDLEEDMQNYTVLHIYGYLRNSEGKCLAVEEAGCTLVLDNDGGENFVHEDVNIQLSGKKTYGTVDEIVATPTFVPYVVPSV